MHGSLAGNSSIFWLKLYNELRLFLFRQLELAFALMLYPVTRDDSHNYNILHQIAPPKPLCEILMQLFWLIFAENHYRDGPVITNRLTWHVVQYV